MPFALLLALAAIAGATTLTYLYDREAIFLSRLCAGVCIGFALLGLVGFVLASLMGMTPGALALAGVVCASPLVLLSREALRGRLKSDVAGCARVLNKAVVRPGKGETGGLIFYVVAAVLFWFVFAHAMYTTPQGIFTGVDTNIGDLPFHIAVVTGFVYGENFPPQHPEFAGARLTYPFVVDFVTAMFVRAGASLEGAMFWQNFAMMMSLVGLLHRWALKLTRDRAAAFVTIALVLLSGGFGWRAFLGEALKGGRGIVGLLGSLEHDYTIMGHLGYRWGNAVTALFVTQRGIVLGLALALVVWTLWWEACEKTEGKGQKAEGSSVERKGASARLVGRGSSKFESRGVVKKRLKEKTAKEQGKEVGRKAGGVSDGMSAGDETFAFCLLPFALRPMVAAGIIAGLLPLVHAHSFVVMMLMGACLALMQGVAVLLMKGEEAEAEVSRAEVSKPEGKGSASFDRTYVLANESASVLSKVWAVWWPWVLFASAASVIAVPQMLWATRDSAARAGQFFGWQFGWDHGEENVAWFWLKNTGFFIPLLVAAIAWRGRMPVVSRRLIFFFLPFTLCFVVPNIYKLSPWIWDNIKVLLYWWIASAPLVALVLVRLWGTRGVWRSLALLCVLIMQTAAGALDVWRAAVVPTGRLEFDANALSFSDVIRRETPPRALILHAPTYNDPVYLTGRRTYLGYPGHVWSHGIAYAEREADLKTIYAGSPGAPELIRARGIEYIVVGPLEREEMRQRGVALNEAFFNRYTKVGEAGGFQLYKTKQ